MYWALIVEDDEAAARELQNALFALGKRAVVVTTSVAATEKALQQPYDLVFLDAQVTNGATFDIARKLKQSGTPFLFVTDAAEKVIPPELKNTPFVKRPFTRRELEAALLQLVDRERWK